MHYVLHVIHPSMPEHQLHDFLSDRLKPFWEELEVEPYRKYISVKGFKSMNEYYDKKENAPTDIFERLQEWEGQEWFTDNAIASDADDLYTSYYTMSTWNPQGEWDWWVIGGRWADYWETGKDTLPVDEVLMLRPDAKYAWMEEGPYAYLTMEGEWIAKKLYNPDGEGYDENDPNSIFPPNPDFMYWNYLNHVVSLGLCVTTVDYHC